MKYDLGPTYWHISWWRHHGGSDDSSAKIKKWRNLKICLNEYVWLHFWNFDTLFPLSAIRHWTWNLSTTNPPLVFSTTGGMGEEAKHFLKRVATLIAYKKGNLYSDFVSYIRRKLSFCLIRTVLVALRGYRGREVISENINSDINLIKSLKVTY